MGGFFQRITTLPKRLNSIDDIGKSQPKDWMRTGLVQGGLIYGAGAALPGGWGGISSAINGLQPFAGAAKALTGGVPVNKVALKNLPTIMQNLKQYAPLLGSILPNSMASPGSGMQKDALNQSTAEMQNRDSAFEFLRQQMEGGASPDELFRIRQGQAALQRNFMSSLGQVQGMGSNIGVPNSAATNRGALTSTSAFLQAAAQQRAQAQAALNARRGEAARAILGNAGNPMQVSNAWDQYQQTALSPLEQLAKIMGYQGGMGGTPAPPAPAPVDMETEMGPRPDAPYYLPSAESARTPAPPTPAATARTPATPQVAGVPQVASPVATRGSVAPPAPAPFMPGGDITPYAYNGPPVPQTSIPGTEWTPAWPASAAAGLGNPEGEARGAWEGQISAPPPAPAATTVTGPPPETISAPRPYDPTAPAEDVQTLIFNSPFVRSSTDTGNLRDLKTEMDFSKVTPTDTVITDRALPEWRRLERESGGYEPGETASLDKVVSATPGQLFLLSGILDQAGYGVFGGREQERWTQTVRGYFDSHKGTESVNLVELARYYAEKEKLRFPEGVAIVGRKED